MRAPVRAGEQLTVNCQDVTGAPFHGDVTVLAVAALDPDGGPRWRCRFRRPGARADDPLEHVQIVIGPDARVITGGTT